MADSTIVEFKDLAEWFQLDLIEEAEMQVMQVHLDGEHKICLQLPNLDPEDGAPLETRGLFIIEYAANESTMSAS